MAARKTVTVVFCDIVDSTALGERIDPEVHRRIQERYFETVRETLERHGGTVEKFIGDAAMAVFGIPVTHDDDALRAVRAAADLRPALSMLNDELARQHDVTIAIRTGVNTGEVIAGDPASGQSFATGDAVATAQRLEAAARTGEILIGDPTYRLVSNAALVEPVEPLILKGKAEPVPAWRLLGVVEGAPPFPRRLDTPMVGRHDELELLRGELRLAIEERRCRLATIVGPAGIGKSRLGNELLRASGVDVEALVGRCLPYGEGVTYWPIRGIVMGAVGHLAPERIAARLGDLEDAERIGALLAGAMGSAETPVASEETFSAVRRFLEQLARERPLIVGLDELQWAEPTMLDLVEYLVGWATDAPILLLGLGRPELAERRPGWPVTIALGPLSTDETEELANVLGAPADERQRITAAAEGNPLFLEQLVALEDEGGRETIPPSIHAILAARLDRLEPAERDVVERAAVIGREFTRGGVSALSDDGSVGQTLLALVRRELIEPDSSPAQGEEDGFRFRHVLIRDAAYLGVAKQSRAALHERYADWLETGGALDEQIGYHLEQAHLYRRELGIGDEELGARAGRHLAAAGRRAAGLGDTPASASLLVRAVALLPPDDPDRAILQAELGSALMRGGAMQEAHDVFMEALTATVAGGDRALELRLRLELMFHRSFAEPQAALEEAPALTAEIIPELEHLGEHLSLARAWRLRSDVYLNACLWGKRAEALRRAFEHARRADDPAEIASISMALATALYYGPTRADEAIAECEQLLSGDLENRALEAAVTAVVAGLHAMKGDEEKARRLWESSRSLSDQLGQRFRGAAIALWAADIELISGHPEEAASVLRWSTGLLQEMGVVSSMSTHAAVLSDILGQLGEFEAAEEYAALSESSAAQDDVFSQAFWRMGKARALAGRGEDERAEALAREALELAASTDSPDLKARALLAAGDPASAAREYERKGNTTAVARITAASPRSS